jgi:hypothetical protein
VNRHRQIVSACPKSQKQKSRQRFGHCRWIVNTKAHWVIHGSERPATLASEGCWYEQNWLGVLGTSAATLPFDLEPLFGTAAN